MPVKPQEFRQLSGLFARYGVDEFLEFTSSLVTILDREGSFLAWNLSMEKLKRNSAGGCKGAGFSLRPEPGSVR